MSELTAQKSRLQTEAGERREARGATPQGALQGQLGKKKGQTLFGGEFLQKHFFRKETIGITQKKSCSKYSERGEHRV